METKEKVSFIHRSEDHANGGCDGGFIAYGVYFNRKCKVFGDSKQCQ